MASNLHVCYSPAGEKFELTRPNFLDATQNYGFTATPPNGVPAEAEDKDEDDGASSTEGSTGADADAEEDAEVEIAEIEEDEEAVSVDAAPEFDPENRDSVKAYLRKYGIEFDGRASLSDLVALANG